MSREPSCRQCRLSAAGQWIGWHLLELTAVGVPLVLAVTVSVWWLALAVLAGGLWLGHELHLSRSQPTEPAHPVVAAGPQQPAVTATSEPAPSTSDSIPNASKSSQEASA